MRHVYGRGSANQTATGDTGGRCSFQQGARLEVEAEAQCRIGVANAKGRAARMMRAHCEVGPVVEEHRDGHLWVGILDAGYSSDRQRTGRCSIAIAESADLCAGADVELKAVAAQREAELVVAANSPPPAGEGNIGIKVQRSAG